MVSPNEPKSEDYSNSDTDNLSPGIFSPDNTTDIMAWSQVLFYTIFSIIFIVGLIGNGLVLCVLVKYHKRSNMSDVCLFNLALSNLLYLLILPFWAHYVAINQWVFGSFMCHAVTAFHMLGYYGSIFFMMLMTIDRYTIIVHTDTFLLPKYRSVRVIIALNLFTWTLSLVASLPDIIFSKAMTINNTNQWICYVEFPNYEWVLFSYIEMNILGLTIPLSVMVFCYSRIIPILMVMKSQKKYKAVRLILVLVSVFFIFSMPYYIVMFLNFLQDLGYISTSQWYNLFMAILWMEGISFIYCCINPIIYAFVGQRFRNLFLKILKEWFPLCFGHCPIFESIYRG